MAILAMATTIYRGGNLRMIYVVIALCWHLLSIVSTQHSCAVETYKVTGLPCRQLLRCRELSDWSSLSDELKAKSNHQLCGIVVDCANKIIISNFDFRAIGGEFSSIVDITISQCNTTQIRIDDNMFYLYNVDLNGNAFESLDFMENWQNTEFETLHLYNNRIKTVRQKDFAKFYQLSSLRLDSNLITDVDARSFQNNHRLSNVDLSNNRIETIGEDTFQAMKWLKSVRLARNRIKRLIDGAFDNVHLDSLDLSHNDITSVPNSVFVDSSVLSLNVSNCHLSNIPSGFLSSLAPNLTTLDISHNGIKHVASDAFAHLSQLRVVYHTGLNIDPSVLPAETTTKAITTSPKTTTTTTTSSAVSSTTTPSRTPTTTTPPTSAVTTTTSAAAAAARTTTVLQPSSSISNKVTAISSTTSQTTALYYITQTSKSNTLIFIIIALALLIVVIIVIAVILQRKQPSKPPDPGVPVIDSDRSQETENYEIIPFDYQPDYTSLNDRRNESAVDTYTPMRGGAASSAADKQPTTTDRDIDTLPNQHTNMYESTVSHNELPYEDKGTYGPYKELCAGHTQSADVCHVYMTAC